MELNRFSDQFDNLLLGVAYRDAAREIGDEGTVSVAALLNDDRVSSLFHLSVLGALLDGGRF